MILGFLEVIKIGLIIYFSWALITMIFDHPDERFVASVMVIFIFLLISKLPNNKDRKYE